MARNTFSQRMRSARTDLASRSRLGMSRVRAGFFQSIQITVAAVGAYFLAEVLLRHHQPLFAATAAIVSLGYVSGGNHMRRILEVAIGCTLGIAVGDSLMYFLGRGPLQAFAVLLVSLLLARFLDNGTIFSTQMGLQAVLVVLLPPAIDGPFARSLDAVVGGLCALVIMALVPQDPRRQPKDQMIQLTREFSRVLREASEAIGNYDATLAWHALARARKTQPTLDSIESSLKTSKSLAKVALTRRQALDDVRAYERALQGFDYSIRNARVLVRRIANVITTVHLRDEAIRSLRDVLLELSEAVDVLGLSLKAESTDARDAMLRRARIDLSSVAAKLDPQLLGVRTYQGEALVMIIRPLTVDLLVMTGMDQRAAGNVLATIRQELTEAIDIVDPEEPQDTDS
ncbi:FUSC family protein [Curtobacterium sp. S6]|uniref:FUSC family protein n=1 Tax=Curtobacterium sp. S6 TaxID=1479623 RepID=UPI0009E6F83A|nr:FUSC family protein [Curtobacterium sp. S6]